MEKDFFLLLPFHYIHSFFFIRFSFWYKNNIKLEIQWFWWGCRYEKKTAFCRSIYTEVEKKILLIKLNSFPVDKHVKLIFSFFILIKLRRRGSTECVFGLLAVESLGASESVHPFIRSLPIPQGNLVSPDSALLNTPCVRPMCSTFRFVHSICAIDLNVCHTINENLDLFFFFIIKNVILICCFNK